jgi:hypothetical protein
VVRAEAMKHLLPAHDRGKRGSRFKRYTAAAGAADCVAVNAMHVVHHAHDVTTAAAAGAYTCTSQQAVENFCWYMMSCQQALLTS